MTPTDDEVLAAYLRDRALPSIPASSVDLVDVLARSRRKRHARLAVVTTLTVLGIATGVTGVVAVAGQAGDPRAVGTDGATPTGRTEATRGEGPGPISSSWVDEARAGGASQEQVAILEDGQLTFEEYESAVGRALACMRDAGIEVHGGTLPQSPGFPLITYGYGVTSPGRTGAETQAVSDSCLATHSQYVEGAYQTAPAVVEAVNVRFEPYREAIIACVRVNGGDVADDAIREKVLIAASDVRSDAGVDCVHESGFR